MLGTHQRGIAHQIHTATEIGRVRYWLCSVSLWIVERRYPGQKSGKTDWRGGVALHGDEAAKCRHDGVKRITKSGVDECSLWREESGLVW